MIKKIINIFRNQTLLRLFLGILLILLIINLFTSFNFNNSLFRFFFILGTILLAKLLQLPSHHKEISLGWSHFVVLFVCSFSLLLAYLSEYQIFGWIFLSTYFSILINFAENLKGLSRLKKISIFLSLTFFAGFVPIITNQIFTRFSDEEFYTAIMMVGFSFIWTLIYSVFHFIIRDIKKIPFSYFKEIVRCKKSTAITLTWGTIIVLIVITINQYQSSFFPKDGIPTYPGITAETPFICGTNEVNQVDQGLDGPAIQSTFADLLASKENLKTNDYAFLAIYENNEIYANAFKENLLDEAENENYTEPAKSVKYDQYLASQTIYFYEKVKKNFPNLFINSEIIFIENWIEKINERALTIELVDVFYGLAFSQKPVGAYQNQDIGAGLYAQLLNSNFKNGLSLKQNKAYLENSDFGWDRGFRVLDDSINYQPVWITNAYLHGLYSGTESQLNQRHSFEWLLYQALPDGNIINYNFPFKISPGPVSLLGANILNDGQMLWLANKAAQSVEDPKYIYPQVGSEVPIDDNLRSEKPSVGSCLLYGDSGLPGNEGPLAPDKVVFRNGWDDDDLYILLNLRFTGWHRYKSTNGIVLIYAGEELVKERYTQNPIQWLPAGRAMVRDKRIPIEQLNTLLIPRAGLDAVINTIIDWLGPYAQDPPFYSEIDSFGTSDKMDHIKTSIKDWHGWKFTRSVFFYHDGPAFIIDNADSKKQRKAAINYHFAEGYDLNERRATNLNNNIDFLFIGQENSKLLDFIEDDGLLVQYQSEDPGNLNLLTVILPDEWQNAELVSYRDGIISLQLDDQLFDYSLELRESD